MHNNSLILSFILILLLFLRLTVEVLISAKNEVIIFRHLVTSQPTSCLFTHKKWYYRIPKCEAYALGESLLITGHESQHAEELDNSLSRFSSIFDRGFFSKKELIIQDISINYEKDDSYFVWKSYIVTKILSYKNYSKHLVDAQIDQKVSGLIQALILGDAYELSTEQKHSFLVTGILHLVVVSGQHVSLVISGCAGVLKRVPKGSMRFGITAVISFFIAVVTGMGPSVIRAIGVINLKEFSSQFWERRVPIIWLCIFSTVLILLIDPWMMISQSFWLSSLAFFAVLSTRVVFPVQKEQSAPNANFFVSSLWSEIVETFNTSLVVFVVLFPVISVWFGQVSLLGPVVTALVSWLVVPIIWVFGLFLLAGFSTQLSSICAFILEFLSSVLLNIVSIFDGATWLVLDLKEASVVTVLALWLVSLLLLFLYRLAFIRIFSRDTI